MAPIKHGHAKRTADGGRSYSPEYVAWRAMKNRCLNPKQARYKDYGARGIKICDRWLVGDGQRSGFECFLADLGQKPSSAHSLERQDNERGYEPGNVKWATRTEQARNTRATRIVDVCGFDLSLTEAAERWGAVPTGTVRMRLHRGWSVDDALFVPAGGKPGDADCQLWPITRAAERVTVVI